MSNGQVQCRTYNPKWTEDFDDKLGHEWSYHSPGQCGSTLHRFFHLCINTVSMEQD